MGILLPVLGDLAKAGKLSKFVRTMERIVEVAKTDARFAERVRPMLQQLKGALDSVSMDKLPQAMREPLKRLKGKVDEFFGSTRRDVRAHEATPVKPELGHTIERHVGKSETWLRQRLEADPKLKAASSFRNEAVANRAQAQFMQQHRAEIDAWLKGDSRRPYEGAVVMNEPAGIVVTRGKGGATGVKTVVETNKAWFVVVRDNSEFGYHIRTSFSMK